MTSLEKFTILYGRLSQEDTQKGKREDDSNSIQNQRLLLEKYAADKGFPNTKFIYDDGYTGTNFNRPGWQEVMELIESGKVATLIVKDMSRLGREYLQVGRYTEIVFPSYGVRFIAVNDGVDSLYENTNDFTPFRNIMNEWYAKDCSKKGRDIVRLKAETGARVASRPPFGYLKDPADPKRHIVPDPETAPIVQYIFRLCVEGNGPVQIARKLTEAGVPTPAAFYYKQNGVAITGFHVDNPNDWSSPMIAHLLENESYLGHTINLRRTTISYKNKKPINRPVSEQVRIENTHEPLIDQQTWDIVQDIRSHKKRRPNMAEQDIFSGLVYCADCGKVMTLRRYRAAKPDSYSFICSASRKQGKETCSPHYIRECEMAAVVLDDIRRITHFARQNEAMFARYIGQKHGQETQREMSQLQKELDTLVRRQKELMALFKRLYEDNVLGRLPEEQYRILSDGYMAEQNTIKERQPQVEDRLKELKESATNISRFLENARRYTQIDELTSEILRTFIQRIEIGERSKKHSRTATQEIRIYYRDIGLLDDAPEEQPQEETNEAHTVA